MTEIIIINGTMLIIYFSVFQLLVKSMELRGMKPLLHFKAKRRFSSHLPDTFAIQQL